MSTMRVKNKDGTWDKVPVLGSYQAVLAANEAATNAQNAANAAEAVAPEYAKTKEVLDNIVNYTNTATEQASIATAKAEAASTSATNAAQSYANADGIATQLTEYLATKETLTAPAVDKTLLIEGAAADSKVVGELKSELVDLKKGYTTLVSSDFKQGMYENGEYHPTELKRITSELGYVCKGCEAIISHNGLYYRLEVFSDNTCSNVLQTTGYTQDASVKVNESGYAIVTVANSNTYETSTTIRPSDYNMNFTLYYNDYFVNDISETTKKLDDRLDFLEDGTSEINSFEKYTVSNGKVSIEDKRIHKIIGFCKKGTSFELKNDNKWLLVDIYPHEFGETQSVIETSGWIACNEAYHINSNGYVALLVANAETYNSSTKILPSDFTGHVKQSSYVMNELSKKLEAQDLLDKAFVSTFNKIGSVENHVKNYSKLYKNIGKGDGFLFFTDMHIIYQNGWENRLKECMAYIEQIANTTPISFVLNGGDWLGSYNTQDEALYMLSRIAGTMRSKFGDKGVMILGNHDTNYQGSLTEEDSSNKIENIEARLSQNAIDNTYSSIRRKSYFKYDAPTFSLYCFDTGIESDGMDTDYYANQIDWFLENLLVEEQEHIVIAMHIIENASIISQMANNVAYFSKIYNERQTTTRNGKTYNFANAKGKVSFIIGGHTHTDKVGSVYSYGIPYVITKNASSYGSYSTLPLDLCAIDWDEGKLYMYRCEIGKDGNTREIDIVT